MKESERERKMEKKRERIQLGTNIHCFSLIHTDIVKR
jgi:hypothetical protein